MPSSIQNLSDSELIAAARQCYNAMNGNLGDYPGVTQAQVDDLKNLTDNFEPEVDRHVQIHVEARAQTQTKDTRRTPVETQYAMLRDVAKANKASAGAIAAMGLPSGGQSAAPSNATVPAASVDTSKRLQHTIRWTDAATPDNKKRPRGSMGAEIFVKIDGPLPTDVKECTYLALDGSSPYLVEYEGEDAGKMAHYMLRWRMNDGSTLAFGETVSATITG